MIYDVAIVGAGPAGLMAAKTAAGKGLRVVVIEKRGDVSRVTRACCQQFVMDENYMGESIKVEKGKVVFPNNGFEVDYNGPTFNITDKYYISPKGRRIHFAYEDGRAVAVKFDKGHLLQGLWEQCQELGVQFRSGTVVYDAVVEDKFVELCLTRLGAHSTLKAAKLIAADGANSGIAESLGMNRARVLYSTGLCISYLMEGLKDYERSAFKSHMGLAYQSRAPLIIYPTVDDESRAYLYVPGNKDQPPEVTFKKVMSGSPLVPVLKDAKVINKTGCSVKMYSSMKVPYRGNVIVIGDAAAYVEVEVQGGLMCGFQAGNAVCKELAEESGFEQYAKWWQETFEFNSDAALQVAQGFALVPTYTDDELDYLFALTEDEVLEGSYSQYKSPKLMWGSILRHRKRIAREQPDLYKKINNNNKLTLRDTF